MCLALHINHYELIVSTVCAFAVCNSWFGTEALDVLATLLLRDFDGEELESDNALVPAAGHATMKRTEYQLGEQCTR